MDNLEIYEKTREVPEEAKKTIGGGKLKGMTDINPMWRIKKLTEVFGACGFGWYYKTTKQWIEDCGDEKIACVNIELFVKLGGEWSQPIFGTGGSKLSTIEKNGVYVSDECFKMATTDAISVACKQLGMGADVYWNKDTTKYTQAEEVEVPKYVTPKMIQDIHNELSRTGLPINTIFERFGLKDITKMTVEQYQKAISGLSKTPSKKVE